ncbi:MAG: nucleotidyltransferase family protein [Candidatus Nomurabacteria bacterium]|nr:nucleotidyltransferase family protein [Candidatus Nomurabacteria bacterium]
MCASDDLLNLIARPTPYYKSGEAQEVFRLRMDNKNWQKQWPDLTVRYN